MTEPTLFVLQTKKQRVKEVKWAVAPQTRTQGTLEPSLGSFPIYHLHFFFFFFFCTAAPVAHGSSHARDGIRAAAEAYAMATATQDLSQICDLTTACGNVRSLTTEQDQGWNKVRSLTQGTTMGTPTTCIFFLNELFRKLKET